MSCNILVGVETHLTYTRADRYADQLVNRGQWDKTTNVLSLETNQIHWWTKYLDPLCTEVESYTVRNRVVVRKMLRKLKNMQV